MGKTSEMYIRLQEELLEKMKTSDDPQHWSFCADLVQQVIDAEYGEMADKKKTHLEISN